jgi:hypothetical protein
VFIILETNKQYYSNRYLSIIYDEYEGCYSITVTKPACDRLDSSKLVEIWVVIYFETNKRNTNVDHISNEKHIYYPLNSQKVSYVPYYVNCSVWQKTQFQLA